MTAGRAPSSRLKALAVDGRSCATAGRRRRRSLLSEKLRAYDPKADTGLIDAAYALAEQAHGTQRRDNGDPYITPSGRGGRHPGRLPARHRLDRHRPAARRDRGHAGQAAGDRRPGSAGEIAGLVDGVTKLTRLELQSDRTKQAENFRKLVLAISRDIRVLLVKLADRLHNMRTLHFVQDPERRRRIARETMEIYAPLAERIGMDAVKTELQTLAFAQLDPEAYATIQARLNFLRGQGADVIEEVRAELKRVCEEAGVERDRGGRAREVALLDLGEDAPAQRRLRAAVRHHGVPHRRADARRRATRRSARCTRPIR